MLHLCRVNLLKMKPLAEEKEYLEVIHQQDIQWRKDFDFYLDELAIFKNRLLEVNGKYSDVEVKIQVSHFENQFYINKNIIDELLHEINLNEAVVTEEVESNPIAYEHRKIRANSEFVGKVIMFQKLYTELKKDFNKFLAKYM
jgi:hypothetical protein